MKKFAALLLALTLALGLTACGGPDGPAVELPGNVTTGYQWTPDEETAERFGELPMDYIEEKSEGEETPVGAPGIFRFTFKPVEGLEAGTYEAAFSYYRPWEGTASTVKTATVSVTVAEDGSMTLGEPEILDLEEAELPVGAVRVELPGNATTGYSWQPTAETAGLFGELAADYLDGNEGSEEPLAGAPGTFIFTVAPTVSHPVAPGDYELLFLYYRPWEGPETAVQQATVTVTVSEDSIFTLAGEPEITDCTPEAE